MSDHGSHTDPMLSNRECKTCHLWLPCCVIEQVEAQARKEGISSSDLVLAALREYIGEDFEEEDTEGCCG